MAERVGAVRLLARSLADFNSKIFIHRACVYMCESGALFDAYQFPLLLFLKLHTRRSKCVLKSRNMARDEREEMRNEHSEKMHVCN